MVSLTATSCVEGIYPYFNIILGVIALAFYPISEKGSKGLSCLEIPGFFDIYDILFC
ncbi:uncharacterized protein METZ01_LOCUS314079 [marine metagenome]|uniref:Uncharacterized protein n=1 Tax=marine metagenome TaxID=408172 RepID=A0A382NLP7_9ZZZZ